MSLCCSPATSGSTFKLNQIISGEALLDLSLPHRVHKVKSLVVEHIGGIKGLWYGSDDRLQCLLLHQVSVTMHNKDRIDWQRSPNLPGDQRKSLVPAPECRKHVVKQVCC